MLFRHRAAQAVHAFWPMAVAVMALHAGPALSAEPRQGVLNFTSSATQEFEHDQMTVVLQVVREGAQAAEVQASLRQALETGLLEARKAVRPAGALEVRTGMFSVSPRYGSNGRVSGWQGTAQMVVEGTDLPAVAQLVTRLQPMSIADVRHGLSRDLRQRKQSAVAAQAIASWRSKAAELAGAFGQPRFTLGEVTVSSDEGMLVQPMMMARAAQADVAAAPPLPVEPGRGQITVTVSGNVLLQP